MNISCHSQRSICLVLSSTLFGNWLIRIDCSPWNINNQLHLVVWLHLWNSFLNSWNSFSSLVCWQFGLMIALWSRSAKLLCVSPVITGRGDCLQTGRPSWFVTSHPGQLILSLWFGTVSTIRRWEISGHTTSWMAADLIHTCAHTHKHPFYVPFFWDHLGEPVPEEIKNFFWTFVVQGKITGRHTNGCHSISTNHQPTSVTAFSLGIKFWYFLF